MKINITMITKNNVIAKAAAYILLGKSKKGNTSKRTVIKYVIPV